MRRPRSWLWALPLLVLLGLAATGRLRAGDVLVAVAVEQVAVLATLDRRDSEYVLVAARTAQGRALLPVGGFLVITTALIWQDVVPLGLDPWGAAALVAATAGREWLRGTADDTLSNDLLRLTLPQVSVAVAVFGTVLAFGSSLVGGLATVLAFTGGEWWAARRGWVGTLDPYGALAVRAPGGGGVAVGLPGQFRVWTRRSWARAEARTPTSRRPRGWARPLPGIPGPTLPPRPPPPPAGPGQQPGNGRGGA